MQPSRAERSLNSMHTHLVQYQKYIKYTSANVRLCRGSVSKVEWVSSNNQTGRGFESCCGWVSYDKIYTALLVGVAMLLKSASLCCRRANQMPIVISIITGYIKLIIIDICVIHFMTSLTSRMAVGCGFINYLSFWSHNCCRTWDDRVLKP